MPVVIPLANHPPRRHSKTYHRQQFTRSLKVLIGVRVIGTPVYTSVHLPPELADSLLHNGSKRMVMLRSNAALLRDYLSVGINRCSSI